MLKDQQPRQEPSSFSNHRQRPKGEEAGKIQPEEELLEKDKRAAVAPMVLGENREGPGGVRPRLRKNEYRKSGEESWVPAKRVISVQTLTSATIGDELSNRERLHNLKYRAWKEVKEHSPV